ncbi:MAG: hypothetical protein IKZ09_10950 [Clostridia bacterium]|nr:hypothetical protein [Clostridia bacterium]
MNIILLFYVLPFLIGVLFRLLFMKSLRGYLVTGVFGIIALILWGNAALNFIPGNEGFGLIATLGSSVFIGSLVTGILLLIFVV